LLVHAGMLRLQRGGDSPVPGAINPRARSALEFPGVLPRRAANSSEARLAASPKLREVRRQQALMSVFRFELEVNCPGEGNMTAMGEQRVAVRAPSCSCCRLCHVRGELERPGIATCPHSQHRACPQCATAYTQEDLCATERQHMTRDELSKAAHDSRQVRMRQAPVQPP